jgi:hypothetical protein
MKDHNIIKSNRKNCLSQGGGKKKIWLSKTQLGAAANELAFSG